METKREKLAKRIDDATFELEKFLKKVGEPSEPNVFFLDKRNPMGYIFIEEQPMPRGQKQELIDCLNVIRDLLLFGEDKKPEREQEPKQN